MPFLTQGKTNWKYILIVLILAVVVGGGILGYLSYFKKEMISLTKFPEIKKPEVEIPEEEIIKIPEEERIKDLISNVEIILRENKLDKRKTDIFIKDLKTDKEELFVILSDLDRWAAVDAEFRNGRLYLSYRSTEGEEPLWKLWKYSFPEDKGNVLFTDEIALYFTISPNENFAAIIESNILPWNTLIFINLITKDQRKFENEELTSNEILSLREKVWEGELPGFQIRIRLGKWSSNSEDFFGFTEVIFPADPPMPSEASIFKLNVKTWKIEKFQIPFDEGIIILHDLNPRKNAILYERVSNKLSLYIYNFSQGRKINIVSYPREIFNKYCGHALDYYYQESPLVTGCDKERRLYPEWLDNDTISYLDFETREKIIKKIE